MLVWWGDEGLECVSVFIFMYVYKQKVAPEMPKVMTTVKQSSSQNDNDTVKVKTGGIAWGHQLWHTNGTLCPRGTVPIRRTSVNDVLRAKSLFDYGKKSQRHNNINTNKQADAPDVVSGNGHEVCNYICIIIIIILSFLSILCMKSMLCVYV